MCPPAELLFQESNAKFPSWKDTWVPRYVRKRARAYTGKPASSDESGGDDDGDSSGAEEVVERKTKDGKTEKVVVKKPKGPMKGVELQGKVGGRRRVVKNRPAPAKDEKEKEKK